MFHCSAISTSPLSYVSLMSMTVANNGSFDALRCVTKSMMPPSYLKTCSVDRVDALVAEDDLEALVEERHLAQALEQRLGAELELFHDRAVGPERDARAVLVGVADALAAAPTGSPPSTNAIAKRPPSRWISSSSRRDSAFTTDTPTPCRPPEIL